MTTRGLTVLVAGAILAAGTLWSAVRFARPADDSATMAGAVAVGTVPDGPDGAGTTLNFFRDPSEVPAISIRDLEGRTLSSSEWKGKVVVVNFWATWCPPCRAEIPDLVALQDKYRDRLLVIGVSEDEGPVEQVQRFAKQYQVNYPIVMVTPELKKAFPGVAALPTSFILDTDTRVVQRHVGMLQATLTELETRALLGIPIKATIARVDKSQGLKLENAAQVTEIPGVDLSSLSAERRVAAVQKLNSEDCTCGCGLSVAKCRIDDPQCSVSLPLARDMVSKLTGE